MIYIYAYADGSGRDDLHIHRVLNPKAFKIFEQKGFKVEYIKWMCARADGIGFNNE